MIREKKTASSTILKSNEKTHSPDGAFKDASVFIMLNSIGIVILLPVFLAVNTIRSSIMMGDYTRIALVLSATLMLITPTYITNRYHPGTLPYVARLFRGWVAPVLLTIAWYPSETLDFHGWISKNEEYGRLENAVILTLLMKTALGYYRMLCRPPDFHVTKAARLGHHHLHSLPENVNPDEPSLRILVFGDAFPPKVDGVSTFGEESIERLQKYGNIVRVLTSARGGDNIRGAPVTFLPGKTTPVSLNHSVSIPVPTILWEFVKFKPHVVCNLEIGVLTLVVSFYCLIADIPCCMSHHTRLDLYVDLLTPSLPHWVNSMALGTLERLLYPLADQNPVVCSYLYNRVKNDCLGCDVRMWSSGVTTNFSSKNKSEEWRRIGSQGRPDLPLVLYFGRIDGEKNSNELPDIIKHTIAKMGGIDKVRFMIVGDGKYRAGVEEQLKGNDAVFFAGLQRGKNLYEAVASCDVFFSPSTTEALPLVYLEAMRSGLSVVAPTFGGSMDTFSDGVEGFYCEPWNPESMAEAIVKTIKGGAAMRERAEKHGLSFSWEKSSRELEIMLQDLVKRKENASLF